MAITRRGFFGLLAGVPFLRRIPLRKFPLRYYSVTVPITLDDINAIATKTIPPVCVDNFFKSSPLLAYMKDRDKWEELS